MPERVREVYLAKKNGPCHLCGEEVLAGSRISKLAKGHNMNRWAHERCAMTELVAMKAITPEDAQRAERVAPRVYTRP